MAHQTGIHGESGWRTGRGPRVSAHGCAPWLALGPCFFPGTSLGKLPVLFCSRGSPGVGTSWWDADLLCIVEGGRTCTHTAGVEVSVFPSMYFCLCVPIFVFLFLSGGGCTRMCTSEGVCTHVHLSCVYSPVCAHLDLTACVHLVHMH